MDVLRRWGHMRSPLLPLAIVLSLAGPAGAQDILKPLGAFLEEVLPRPAPRPAPPSAPVPPPEPETAAISAEAEPPPLPRPRPRPEGLGEEVVEAEDAPAIEAAPLPSDPPEEDGALPRSDRVYQTACPALLSGRVVGEMLPPIEEGMCGERSPLLVTAVAVNGRVVPFSAPVTTNCAMAGALADWVAEVDAYAGAALDSALTQLNTGTSMMCRARNGGDAGLVSEHGFANALDVVGMTLDDGRVISVEADWLPAAAPAGRLLRQAHGAACARFTTVLGPEANREHEDHLHLDLGCHGQSCMAQICE